MSAATAAHRYAVCYAPNPGGLGWLAGSHWLGRCAALLQPLEQLHIEGVNPEDLQRLTAAPRRLGWHAPISTPFALAPGADWITLHRAVQRLAHSLVPCTLPPLHVAHLHQSDVGLALVPAAAHPTNALLRQAASDCAAQLGPLAAARKGADTLFGQCEFRFHMPITGPLNLVDAATQALVLDAAQEYFSDLPTLQFNSLALFAQPTPDTDFVLLDHLEMTS